MANGAQGKPLENELVRAVREAGVVGAGGAGFPTHVKLAAQVEYVIVNAAECEPLLDVDPQLTCQQADRLVHALGTVGEFTGAQKLVVGIKGKHREACESLARAVEGRRNTSVQYLANHYPVGDEHVLVYEVTGRLVPEGGIPLQVGAVVNNVETLLNVEAALNGEPVTQKYLTVVGEVQRPITTRVPVGSLVKDVLELAGGPTVRDYAVVDGGPMMGNVMSGPEAPITKTTKALVVLPREKLPWIKKGVNVAAILRRAKATCDLCHQCTQLCPRYLLGHDLQPHRVMHIFGHNIADEKVATSAFLCCECGICDLYACPMDLSPRWVCIELKRRLTAAGIKNPHRRTELTPHPWREMRGAPVDRLLARLGLGEYDRPAPMTEVDFEPSVVRLPLKQHLGAPAQPTVSVGDRVQAGQVVGEIPEGALGARVHASILGVVREVGSAIVIERA